MRWLLAISCIFIAGCQSGGGLGLFERKPETTPGDLRVEQYEDEDGKKTVVTGTNDANAKEGISVEVSPDGNIKAGSGGSRKLEKWDDGDVSTIWQWGWVFLSVCVISCLLRYNGVFMIPAAFCFSSGGIAIFNLTVGPWLLPMLTGMIWNLICVVWLVNILVPGAWANIKQAAAGK